MMIIIRVMIIESRNTSKRIRMIVGVTLVTIVIVKMTVIIKNPLYYCQFLVRLRARKI